MLLSGKISAHFKSQKRVYILLLATCLLGFLIGCFYSNLISNADFTDAGSRAEEFIKQAKEHELNFQLMLSEELSVYLFIALFSLFLFGVIPTVFLVFKWGFSAGFFMTFLVRYFSMKGFFLGGLFLIMNLIFFLPALLLLSAKSVKTNGFLLTSVFNRNSHGSTLAEELLGLAVVTFGAVLLVSLGVFFKILLLPPLCGYLFL